MTKLISQSVRFEHTPLHVHLEFLMPRTVISSAVFNGGVTQASHIVNLKVPDQVQTEESVESTLTQYCQDSGWMGVSVGMMTAASMNSLCVASQNVQGVDIEVLVTSGLSNPRRAGDPAEYQQIGSTVTDVGTINIIVISSAELTMPAMVEAVMIVTEAKAAALQDAGVVSPVSNRCATGTGTDAIAIVNGDGVHRVEFCGKHVLFGEILAKLVIRAVTESIG